MIYEMVVYCGARKVFRILNITTGSIYSMDYETEKEASDAIEDGEERCGDIVKRISIGDMRTLLRREFPVKTPNSFAGGARYIEGID